MTAAQIVVTVAGIALIGWVLWYFFLAARTEARAEAVGGTQQIRIHVKGGYTPAVVRVQAGRPVRLDFFRDESNPCTEEVVLPDFGIRTWLPEHETTASRVHAGHARQLEFACGMGMVHGRLIVEPAS